MFTSVVSRHPSLVQAASYVAAAVEKEGSSLTTARVRRRNRRSNPRDEGSDEDMANIEPGVSLQLDAILNANNNNNNNNNSDNNNSNN